MVVVSVVAFYSKDPSSNPAEICSFYSVNCLINSLVVVNVLAIYYKDQSSNCAEVRSFSVNCSTINEKETEGVPFLTQKQLPT